MRTIIHEVVADINDAAAEIVLVVHWIGGVHSEMRLPKRRRGQRNSTSVDVITAVRQLVLIANDDLIAGILNRNGLKTGNGNRWTRERVTSMRSNYRISVFKLAEDGIKPWLNLSNAAKLLHMRPRRCGLLRRPERSRQSILSRTDHGSSPAPRSANISRPINHRTGTTEPKIPRGIGPRPTKPLLFNHIERWVF